MLSWNPLPSGELLLRMWMLWLTYDEHGVFPHLEAECPGQRVVYIDLEASNLGGREERQAVRDLRGHICFP